VHSLITELNQKEDQLRQFLNEIQIAKSSLDESLAREAKLKDSEKKLNEKITQLSGSLQEAKETILDLEE
jgi:DNA repair ATPase RecN